MQLPVVDIPGQNSHFNKCLCLSGYSAVRLLCNRVTVVFNVPNFRKFPSAWLMSAPPMSLHACGIKLLLGRPLLLFHWLVGLMTRLSQDSLIVYCLIVVLLQP